MNKEKHNMRMIGRREFVDFPELQLFAIEAKIDTGAYTSSIHCKDILLKNINDKLVLCFKLLDDTHPEYSEKMHIFGEYGRKKIKNSFGEMEERFIIKTKIKVGKKLIRTTLSLSDREHMRCPVLIGRRLLKRKFIIDVSKIHTNGLKLENVLNEYI
jgi:hypothetical protein